MKQVERTWDGYYPSFCVYLNESPGIALINEYMYCSASFEVDVVEISKVQSFPNGCGNQKLKKNLE